MVHTNIYIKKDIWKKLRDVGNRSAVIDKALREHYARLKRKRRVKKT